MKSLIIFFSLFFVISSFAYNPDDIPLQADKAPAYLNGVGVKEQLGKFITKSLTFSNDHKQVLTLKDYLNFQKPLVLNLVYFRCPSLCNHTLNGLAQAIKESKWKIGKDYRVLSISVNPQEDVIIAASKKEIYLEAFEGENSKKDVENFWYFLTGKATDIRLLAKDLGVKYRYSKKDKQYLHPSTLIFVSPKGKVTRYLHGIQFVPKDFDLSIQEASEGKTGNFLDQVLFFCSRFDPKKGKYTIYAWRVMQAGGIFTVFIMLLFLFPIWFSKKDKFNVRDRG
ncbi:MAG: SCO family protein [Bdellovibrionaceae bacterium]|nr:SCO family protein [Pseudobdellovibrionaceae bacterium]